MSTELQRYDAACRALVAAKTTDEVCKIRNTAEAMRAYARQAKNHSLQVDAAEIRLRAERRLGELLQQQKQTVGLAKGQLLRGSKLEPRDDAPTLESAGIDKKLSMRAQDLARVPAKEFARELAEWRERVSRETERVTTNLRHAGKRELVRRARPDQPLPAGHFRLLYADPPWRYDYTATESRAIENQYPSMPLERICALPVPAADEAVLFLWATSPKLADAMQVIQGWGFTYRTCAVWDKEQIGMGYYFRQQHELLLVATRGALPVPAPSARPSSVIRARRAKHSEKPERVYVLLETMYPSFNETDRVELFSRQVRPGWSTWSNEPLEVAV